MTALDGRLMVGLQLRHMEYRCGETTLFTHLQLIKAAFLAVLETRNVGSTWLQREREIFEL